MEELYNLPKNLKDLRKQFGYSQTYVANQIGITYQSYQHYEWGLTVPTLQNFIKIAKLYNVSYEDLLEK
ncbi:MAG: helix-turn-helix domain-containing protein [Clostridia bacterium]|nr:helix-turn-helix domain-containing protein [Clostridia bacterium]